MTKAVYPVAKEIVVALMLFDSPWINFTFSPYKQIWSGIILSYQVVLLWQQNV